MPQKKPTKIRAEHNVHGISQDGSGCSGRSRPTQSGLVYWDCTASLHRCDIQTLDQLKMQKVRMTRLDMCLVIMELKHLYTNNCLLPAFHLR